jgi:hypothetical protein
LRIFQTRWFARFARREGIGDIQLVDAVRRAEGGLVDAELGGGLIKQRVARLSRGRSSGWRTLIAFRSGEISVFVYGFAKNARSNIDRDELADLKRLAAYFLTLQQDILERLLLAGELIEVRDDEAKTDFP